MDCVRRLRGDADDFENFTWRHGRRAGLSYPRAPPTASRSAELMAVTGGAESIRADLDLHVHYALLAVKCECGNDVFFKYRRIADSLPVVVLWFLAPVAVLATWLVRGGPSASVVVGGLVALTLVSRTDWAQRWYWGGLKCERCGRFMMYR